MCLAAQRRWQPFKSERKKRPDVWKFEWRKLTDISGVKAWYDIYHHNIHMYVKDHYPMIWVKDSSWIMGGFCYVSRVLYLYECFVTFSSRVISTGYDSPVAACKHVHKIQNGDLLHLIRLDYLLLLELTFWPELSIFSLIIEKLVSCLGC